MWVIREPDNDKYWWTWRTAIAAIKHEIRLTDSGWRGRVPEQWMINLLGDESCVCFSFFASTQTSRIHCICIERKAISMQSTTQWILHECERVFEIYNSNDGLSKCSRTQASNASSFFFVRLAVQLTVFACGDVMAVHSRSCACNPIFFPHLWFSYWNANGLLRVRKNK